MLKAINHEITNSSTDELILEFIELRKKTMELFNPLKTEDAVIQSDPFGSPPNWHIAHVTWFYQKILEKHSKESSKIKNTFKTSEINTDYLNSYYQQFKNILPKDQRGRFPRPTVSQSIEYRKTIDKCIINFLKTFKKKLPEKIKYDILLANHHEMQHQELMIYDIQNYFARFSDPDDNYNIKRINKKPDTRYKNSRKMVEIDGGIYNLGFKGIGFSYDNELPEHKIYLHPYKIDITPVSNDDFIKFIEDDGYKRFEFWLADGWEKVKSENWNSPLYWFERDGKWFKKDFSGIKEIDLEEPVVNISYYEADAYAKWIGKRLPTEAEWEKAASWNERLQEKTPYPWGNDNPTEEHANLLESSIWSPTKIGSFERGKSHYGCYQMIGDVWEWTSSEYVLYPGFKSRFSEYTDKWAINQKVLRGGCFATPRKQIRNSYRNYFKPHERILFAGFRCAKDLD